MSRIVCDVGCETDVLVSETVRAALKFRASAHLSIQNEGQCLCGGSPKKQENAILEACREAA